METEETMKIKERETYVPAKVTIIEMVQENVICQSGSTEGYAPGDTSGWFNN